MSSRFLNNFRIRFHFNLFKPAFVFSVVVLLIPLNIYAQQRRPAPGGGPRAVVVDERLAVLRDGPSLSAYLLKRLSRGRQVSLLSTRRSSDGVTFYRVAVTRRTRGWLQREAVVSPARTGDDERLLTLIQASNDFDRVARASIFLETFARSAYRPAVLLILGTSVEDMAKKLSKEASRRLDENEMKANHAATFSYFLNYNGLDRYRRLRIDFVFDEMQKQYHYDGTCWREIVRKYPRSAEAADARKYLDSLSSIMNQRKE